MRLPRYRVRTLLIAVGVLAVLLAGGLECLRLRRLSAKYRYIAWAIGNDVRSYLGNLARMETMLRRLRDSAQAEGSHLSEEDRAYLIELPVSIERTQASIAASANIVQIYEHAAAHPWEAPPEIIPPHGNVRNSPIVQRFLSGPPAPRPPTPAEFLPRPDASPPPPPPPAPRGPSPPQGQVSSRTDSPP
jgi:hypothetical protein